MKLRNHEGLADIGGSEWESVLQFLTERSQAGIGLGSIAVVTPDASIRLFRDRPVYPNSIFVDAAPSAVPANDAVALAAQNDQGQFVGGITTAIRFGRSKQRETSVSP